MQKGIILIHILRMSSFHVYPKGKKWMGRGHVIRDSFLSLNQFLDVFCWVHNVRHRRVNMECLQAGRQRVVYFII